MGLDTSLARTPRPTRRQWQAWARREPVLRPLTYDQLRALLDVARRTPHARADALLAALWRLAHHDRDAGRVLLACLLPALRAVAARYRRTLGDEEAFTVAVTAAWDRVARFDPPTSHVAYRLQWLAGRRVHQAATRQREHAARQQHLTDELLAFAATPEGLPVRVLLGEAVDAGIVSRQGAWLVWATDCAGLSIGEAAGLLGIGYEATKKQRQRAAAALRGWLDTDRKASA